MMFHEPPFDPELEALLEEGRVIRPVPDAVRARSLARARSLVAAGMPSLPRQRRRVLPVALAASLALVIGATVAVAALHSQASRDARSAPVTRPRVLAPEPVPPPVLPVDTSDSLSLDPPDSLSLPVIAPPSLPSPKPPQRAGHLPTVLGSYAAELELLQRAQTAYAQRDFSGALALVAEHGRRFPNGRLSEEREALRVRALASSGRRDEADRAAATFGDRFPRSVLLRRLGQGPD